VKSVASLGKAKHEKCKQTILKMVENFEGIELVF